MLHESQIVFLRGCFAPQYGGRGRGASRLGQRTAAGHCGNLVKRVWTPPRGLLGVSLQLDKGRSAVASSSFLIVGTPAHCTKRRASLIVSPQKLREQLKLKGLKQPVNLTCFCKYSSNKNLRPNHLAGVREASSC